jgi:hypothetical protein
MSAGSPPVDADLERVLTSYDTCYVWRYGSPSSSLRELYAKAKRDQWDGAADLDWTIDVDPELEPLLPAEINPLRELRALREDDARGAAARPPVPGRLAALAVPARRAGRPDRRLAARLGRAVDGREALRREPDDGRGAPRRGLLALSEARRSSGSGPSTTNLKRLLDGIIQDSRWDLKYLGMQILVEGLAMAAFANFHQLTSEKLLKDLIHLVMRDESRHVAFGILSLEDYYAGMPAAERRDREDFVIEACALMRDRLIGEETADHFGFAREPYRQCMLDSPILQLFRVQLFARIVPNLRRLGLLSPRVRGEFERMGILQFEHADPSAQDAALGLV